VKELKEANAERRKLIKELAAKESTAIIRTEVPTRPDFIMKTSKGVTLIGEVKVVKREFTGTDVARMIQTANELIRRDDSTIALFYGKTDKTSNIVIVSGSLAVNQGLNAGDVVREVSPIIGGGGGGRPNFAQGGGTQPEKLQEAIKKAEETIKQQLKQ
jgi:alanyl-tRNA synthetase